MAMWASVPMLTRREDNSIDQSQKPITFSLRKPTIQELEKALFV